MNRALLVALVALTAACSRPTVVAPPAPPAPAAEPTPATAPEAAPNPALLLGDAELATYLDHMLPLATELAALDADFRTKYHGTAITWDNLVSPTTAQARDALAVRHGYASWSAFATVHNKVVGAMGLLVARALRGISVGANVNRLKEMEQQLEAPVLAPDQRARLQVAVDEMKKRNAELRDRTIGSPNVPDANLAVLGKRQADVTQAFKTLRESLKIKKAEAAASAPATPAPTTAGAPAPTTPVPPVTPPTPTTTPRP